MSSGKTNRRKKKSNVAIEKHDFASKKAKRVPYKDSELRFKCSFCPERFPSPLIVTYHTRNEHNVQIESRKNERLINSKNKKFSIARPGTNMIINIHDDKTPIYWCLECTFASISYDLMIEHCQRHIIDETPVDVGIEPITPIPAEVMGEKVEVDSDTYEEYDDSNKDSYIFTHCDYELLKRGEWPGIFHTFNECKIEKIKRRSIYYYTRIIRFTSEKKASSAPFMLFKCMKCMKHIDPRFVVTHVQENSCNELLKGFSCYKCEIPFLTENSMYFHYRTCVANQATASKIYKTISFNYDHDKQVNALLLKAAGLNMQCESSENYNTVHQTPGIGEPQGGINDNVQLAPGMEEPQAGVNNTAQLTPGIGEPQGGINDNIHQTPGIEEPQVGINDNVHQTPGVEEQQGGITDNVQLAAGMEEPQAGVNNTAQHTPGIGEPQGGLNNTLQQSPDIVQSQVGVKKWQMTKDTRTMIIQGKNKTKESSENAANVVNDKVATVYKCQCELCFHALDPLFKHFKSCTSDLIIKKKSCLQLCSLVFDEQQFMLHSNLHRRGITKFNVKKVTVCDEKVIALNLQHGIKENSRPKENNTNTDITTGKTNDITAKASKKDQVKEIEIHSKAIAPLVKTILNLSNIVTLGSDPKKFVKKQQQTTATSTWAVDPKSDDSIQSNDQAVHEANKEVQNAKQDEPGEKKSIAQTEKNIDNSEAEGTHQLTADGNLHSQNITIYSDSGNNTEENQCMVELVDTTIDVEYTGKKNTCLTKREEHDKILNLEETQVTPNVINNKENEVIHEQSKNNECEERMEETENENVVREGECNIVQKTNANNPEVKEVAAESQDYTEDELLLCEDTPMQVDDNIANSLSTDEEDSLLHYDDE